ncbi:MAG: sigma-70 family RNA polymerase sigma factor [Planctomycetes bacterium]|nr:sigma-70 family RNA polymerase sigma factor [Planctomycetota bacterium]
MNTLEDSPTLKTDQVSMKEDLKFAQQVCAGAEGSFELLVDRWQGPLYQISYRMSGNSHDASDLTQEIFLLLYRKICSFDGRSTLSTWLHTVAMNCCRSGLRRIISRRNREKNVLNDSIHEKETMLEPISPHPSPHDELEHKDRHKKIQQAISALGIEFREALILRELHAMSYGQIAEVLGCSVGTVKSRIARGRLKLKPLLEKGGVL